MNEMFEMIDDGYTQAGQTEGATQNKCMAPNLDSRVWLWEWNSSQGLTHQSLRVFIVQWGRLTNHIQSLSRLSLKTSTSLNLMHYH